ncbi:MAG TPA: ankyrin repeat domain-containing protein [Amaricoccus sp.]|uniref:ankyrin repeat domain-containing protein n=1 Tax=Amaricoccus sp. TaxID=1872485 RepID=UPI002CEABF96|nr:ankyrin repeat domain-containing protein [Amaricoccus sp.]HMQ95286.1 ankyrin repeat domain-containing protein [Amaricoccus sp.]HMR53099.1 ankyrin repeat domain-containing protein [Amaricoccus sp.]HMR61484.1 ankyrin repeat domain-containing protein [Amaricoccus sp.]HMT99948.1 ankyrin repeat domain-containing protein [Amaricoccus sp.]
MSPSLDNLRRRAKDLRKAYEAGDAAARDRIAQNPPRPDGHPLKHADFLHVIAREAGHESWPKLKFAQEAAAMDRAAKAERLAAALHLGQHWIADALLQETPDLAHADLGLECALYDAAAVRARLAADPAAATRIVGARRPILHLAFSRHWQNGGAEADMIATAEALLSAGADVDDGIPAQEGAGHHLSALYGAIGHARNLTMARWLLEHGANPDDDESLYHATELGSRDGLALLLAHGADPRGTNALPRALDFDDYDAVRLLLEAGADPDEGIAPHPSGAPPLVIPALHQAARRMCSGRIAQLLLDHGANPTAEALGHTPWAFARIYGNREIARVLERAGAVTPLSPVEAQLARAADGVVRDRDWIDMGGLSDEMRRLLTRLVWREGTLPHMQRLVAMGFDANQTDEMGMPPLHLAGWEGMAEKMAWLLSLAPDLSHRNGYGGTLFSTILHGSANCPNRASRDHIGCMRIALEHGVALPRPAIAGAGSADMADFLAEWAEARPGQVVEEGVW